MESAVNRTYFSVSGIKIPSFLKCKRNTRYFILCGNTYIGEKRRIVKQLVEKADCIQGFWIVKNNKVQVYISFIHIK
jgi:hypothetical protein